MSLSAHFNTAFFVFILSPSSSSADVTGSFAFAFPFFSRSSPLPSYCSSQGSQWPSLTEANQAAPFCLGGRAGRSASKSSSTRTSSFFSLPAGASSESELDSMGVILVFFVDVGFLGDAAFDFSFSFFLFLFFVALSSLNLRLSLIYFLLLHPRTCLPLCCLQDA